MSAKKKNIIPLFGVAFVVAVIATGVFYGLFVNKLKSADRTAATPVVYLAARGLASGAVIAAKDFTLDAAPKLPLPAGAVQRIEDVEGGILLETMAEKDVLTHARLNASGKGAERASLVPLGMRAVTLQVQDSSGVISFLKPGNKVDVQIVGIRPGDNKQEPQLRNVIENIQVLAVHKEAPASKGGAQVVTVIASPQEASLLGLADSTSKIRLALRNAKDEKHENTPAIGLTSVYTGAQQVSAATGSAPARAQVSQEQFQLLVKVAGGEWKDSVLQLPDASAAPGIQVSALNKGVTLEKATEHMEILSTSNLNSGKGKEAGLHWSLAQSGDAAECSLQIRFTPRMESNGRIVVKIQPEAAVPSLTGLNHRKATTELTLADGQTFLVRGLANAAELPVLWERLFPGKVRTEGRRELLIFVTPKIIRPAGGPASSD